jgi:DNA repair protein RecN (Recombination protein N)
MSALHHFARKYRLDVHQLAQHSQSLIEQQQIYEQAQQQKITLEQRYQEAKQAYQAVALKLRTSRQQYAPLLAEQITANIRPLGMPHGFITIEITPLETMQAHGLDKVEYQVSSNPGMLPDLLSKVASGGELSRISLAIQMIAAQQGSPSTLIFDEIDVGIGGTTAAIVGQKLRQLGERLQVCCVTHQPQVAASAHHHFEVKKYTENQQTFSLITRLTPENKIEEIARMLGGLTITPQTRVHAQEMLVSLGQ